MSALRCFIVATSLLVVHLIGQAAYAQKMYWTDTFTDKVQRSNLDGTSLETIASTGLTAPRGIALDTEAGKVYWSDEGNDWITRANLNGTNSSVVVSGLINPRGLAIDSVGQKLYYVDRGARTVHRANLDGTAQELLVDGLNDPFEVALDLAVGKLYFSDSSPGRILRANLDGSNVETLIDQNLSTPTGLALDLQAGKVYWVDSTAEVVARANLDGSQVEVIIASGLDSPLAVALNVGAGKMYWTEGGPGTSTLSGTIHRANLDGSNIQLLVTGLDNPRGIALDLTCPGITEGSPCSDGDPCTIGDQCVTGQCLGTPADIACDDDNECTMDDVCTGGVCAGTATEASCDDGNRCTENDSCFDGECVGSFNPTLCANVSLQVVAVNGVSCPSCPTSHLPPTEIRPGDLITVELRLSTWDPGLQGTPRIGAYQCGLDTAGLMSGPGGALLFDRPSCSIAADCDRDLSDCTCNQSSCNSGQCDRNATAFINLSHPDYLFAQHQSLEAMRVVTDDIIWGAAILDEGGIADSGESVYLGTLMLRASDDARGLFTLTLIEDTSVLNATLILDLDAVLVPASIIPVQIEFCEVLTSPNDCDDDGVPDECEIDSDGDLIIDDCDLCPNEFTNDSDGDGVCDSQDGCPDDPLKSEPLACGCGNPETDSDSDTVSDCVEVCPGLDDTLDADQNGVPDCLGVPTVSGWGAMVLLLALLVGAKLASQRYAHSNR